MLSNYWIIAIRNLRRNGLFSALNISGLALGVSVCLLILLFVAHETSYDRWNPLADRIVRPTYEIKIKDFNEKHAAVDAIVGPEAAAALPEIAAWCRIQNGGTWDTRREGQSEQNNVTEAVLGADSSFFVLFPAKMVAGDARRCLAQPKAVAISRSRAEFYFSDATKALGQTLRMGRTGEPRQITAIFEDFPENAHFHPQVLVPLADNDDLKNPSQYWGYNNNFFTYFLLREGTDKKVFTDKFMALANQKITILVKDLFATTVTDFEKSGQIAQFGLQNLPDIHLYSSKQSELEANGNVRYVWIFGAIAFFILLIACINFMNLSTARATKRAREVGVRKALGGSRSALTGQFLLESVAMSAMAMLMAVGLAALALPTFNELSGQALAMPVRNPAFWASLLGGTVAVGFLAGSYPAFYLSAFNTIHALKGTKSGGTQGAAFRNGLVVFQFAISTVLIVCTLLVYSQLRFMQQKQLGFDKSQVLMLENANALGPRAQNLKTEMLKNAGVESATVTNFLPLPGRSRENCILSSARATGASDKVLQRWRVDADYVRTLGMQLIQGRNFDPARPADSMAIIINETAARAMGMADPIGQKYYTSRTKAADSKAVDFDEMTIIGVVKDFHFESLHDPIGGLFLQMMPTNGPICLRVNGTKAATVIAALEQQWKNFGADRPIEYRFMDESLHRLYAAEQRIGKIALIFALLSVLVSCLGLFGLAAFTAEQRTKEIGIRKVLGASVAGITGLLAKDFLKLVVLAIVLASPVAYYFMQRWLADFAYRIDIAWWMFAAAGLMAVLIAFLTVSFQSIKAAMADPVESLRSE